MHDGGPEEKVMTISALRSDTTTWDPGGKKGTGGRQAITIANVGANENDTMYTDSRTELDSHANMAVIGRHALILSTSDRTVEVNAFTLEHATIKARLVDATLQYGSPLRWDVIYLSHTKWDTCPIDDKQLDPTISHERSGGGCE